MMNDGVASYYNIAVARLACDMLSLSKRAVQAISAGQAEVFISDAGTSTPASGASFPMWIIAVVVVGALLFLLALVAVVYFVFMKKKSSDENWEKY
jgi:hypothetical protein